MHLQAKDEGGALFVNWTRCSRIDGDIWADGEIPLGEDSEAYVVRVSQFGAVVREETVTAPVWTYAAGDLVNDLTAGPYEISVAQISERFGAGLFSSLELSV